MRTKLQKKIAVPVSPQAKEQVHAQLMHAVGGSIRSQRDPVSYVTESFRQSFDRLGAQRTKELLSGENNEYEKPEEGNPEFSESLQSTQEPAKQDHPVADSGKASPLRHFSELAFQRGKLSASVLRGTGKMMLVSCLKRSLGPDPNGSEEQELLQSGAQQRDVPGHTPDSVLFKRGVTENAVGLVVDTLRDARRVVQSMEALATGTGEVRGEIEGSTLRTMYPFLDDSRERTLLEDYRNQLRESTDVDEWALLQNALVHTRALMDKKAQMKEEFINKLRLVSDRATETLAELEAPGAADEIAAAVLSPEEEELLPPPPPEDDGDNNGTGDTAGEFSAESILRAIEDASGA